MPKFITKLLAGRRSFVESIAWLSVNKAIAVVDAILVGALVARYLGPDRLGAIAFATSVVALLVTVTSFGSDTVVVKELVQDERNRSGVFWSMFAFRFVLGSTLFCCLAGILGLLKVNNLIPSEDVWVLLVVAMTLLSAPLQMGRLALEAKVMMKWYVWSANAVLIFSAIARCLMVYYHMTTIAFAAAQVATVFLTTLVVFAVAYLQGLVPARVTPDWKLIKSFTSLCWPTMLSATCIALYMNADIAILNFLMGKADVGVYSVAVRLSMVWHFVPVVLTTTILPTMAALHLKDRIAYESYLVKLYDVTMTLAYGSLLVSLLVFPFVIRMLFGSAYEPSITIFYVHCLSLPFVFLGVARSQHLMLDGLHRFNFSSTLLGLISNLALNFALVPSIGPVGSAWAAVISSFVAAHLACYLNPKLADVVRFQTEAMLYGPWRLFRTATAAIAVR